MTMKSMNIKIVSAILTVAMLTSCKDDFTAPELPTGQSITSLVTADSEFDLLEASLIKTGLATSLDDPNSGQFTVFAPNDAAMLAFFQSASGFGDPLLSEETAKTKIAAMTNISTPLNLGQLTQRLNYHIISSELKASAFTGPVTYTTLSTPSSTSGAARLSLSLVGTEVWLNANVTNFGAKVIKADVDAANGVVHTIDKVLNAPTTANVLSSIGITAVNYATTPATITGGAENGGDATGTDYDILAYALRKADLVTTLQPNTSILPDFTVFAPTDNAFRAYLGDNTPTASAALENAAIALVKAMSASELADILKYHVVKGRILTSDLTDGQQLTTLLNTTVEVDVNGATITLIDKNAAADPVISQGNTFTNAGVLHRINAVMRKN